MNIRRIGHRVRKAVAWLPMYACYYIGELGFQVCNRWPGDWSDEKRWHDFIPNFAYNVYNKGMWWSCCINDWAGFSLWYGKEDHAE